MSQYAVNEEGVQALNSMANNILDAIEQVNNLANKMQSTADDKTETLGPHYTSLISSLNEIKEAQKKATEPAKEVSISLRDVASAYQDVIDNDKLNTGSSAVENQSNSGNTSGGNSSSTSMGSSGTTNSSASVKESGKAWSDSLSSNERNAVKDYTGTAYLNINSVLRGKESSFDAGNREKAKAIHSALSKSHLPQSCTVYRGASKEALGKYANLPDEALVGKIISDDGFMSTSLNSSDSFGGEVKLEIDVPAGANGAYVGHISRAGHYESEVLFDCGQVMQITGVKKDFFGNRVICVKLLNRR